MHCVDVKNDLRRRLPAEHISIIAGPDVKYKSSWRCHGGANPLTLLRFGYPGFWRVNGGEVR
jgi:hypothetical protein